MGKSCRKIGRQRAAYWLVALTSLWGLGAAPLSHAHADSPSWAQNPLQLKILMRAMTYERHLAVKQSQVVRVGVVFDASAGRLSAAADLVAMFQRQARDKTFLGRRVVVVAVPLVKSAGFRQGLPKELAMLYLSPRLRDEDVRQVVVAATASRLPCMSGVAHHVRHLGVTLGAVLVSGRPRILVNLPAALRVGASFSAQLLQLAEVIGRRHGGGVHAGGVGGSP